MLPFWSTERRGLLVVGQGELVAAGGLEDDDLLVVVEGQLHLRAADVALEVVVVLGRLGGRLGAAVALAEHDREARVAVEEADDHLVVDLGAEERAPRRRRRRGWRAAPRRPPRTSLTSGSRTLIRSSPSGSSSSAVTMPICSPLTAGSSPPAGER